MACGISIDVLRKPQRYQRLQTTSGGRGALGTVGGGCDYQFSPATGWGNWVVGVFADYEFMDLHRNFQGASATSRAMRKNRRLGPSAAGLAIWSRRMSSLTSMAATPKLALIKSTFPSLLARARRSPLSARTPITAGSLAAARKSRSRDSSACRCRPASSCAANIDLPATTAPTLPIFTPRVRRLPLGPSLPKTLEALCPDDHHRFGLQVQLVADTNRRCRIQIENPGGLRRGFSFKQSNSAQRKADRHSQIELGLRHARRKRRQRLRPLDHRHHFIVELAMPGAVRDLAVARTWPVRSTVKLNSTTPSSPRDWASLG